MRPCLLALGWFPQVDKHHVGPPEQIDRLARLQGPAAARDLRLSQPDPHIGRNRDVHHLRVGQVEAVHQIDIVLRPI